MEGHKNLPVFLAVVDDEIDLANLFRDALSQITNVQVFAFSDPMLALEHFQHNHTNYRCIISDYRMPVLNGIELLNAVKKINQGVTCILMSAFEIENDIFKNCTCFDKFLQKPITMGDLLSEVQKYVNEIEMPKQAR